MREIFVICLLAAGWIAVLSDPRVQQFGIGLELVLKPVDPPVPITSITWKHNGNLVAEWVKDLVPLEYLGAYKGRTLLDVKTGELKLSNMKKEDEGEFIVEINNKVQNVRFTAKEIKPVPEPQVVFRPLTCSSSSGTCQLVCRGKDNSDITGSEPIQYFLKEENGLWKESEKETEITNEETQHVKTFSCKMKNQISEKESPAEKNPFIFNSSKDSGSNAPGVAFGVVGIVVFAVLIGVGIWKREVIKKYFKGSNANDLGENNFSENNLGDGGYQEDTAREDTALKSNSEDKHVETNIS